MASNQTKAHETNCSCDLIIPAPLTLGGVRPHSRSAPAMSHGLKAERLFANLCGRHFLRGFVFHSPKFYDPTEKEAGDVVIWVRRQVVVVEILARDAESGVSTKQYVKRIGEKRKQLINDHQAFTNPEIEVHLVNEHGEGVEFNTRDLGEVGFSGIILLDCDDPLEKLHYSSLEKSLSVPFPIAVMTRQDFLDLMSEVDTIPDLAYYLADRAAFLKTVYAQDPRPFLDLNDRLERNLIAFYKLNENHFPIFQWKPTEAFTYYQHYRSSLQKKIEARDAENSRSKIIDSLIDVLRSSNKPEDSTLLHSWELATLTRRQRAGLLSSKIVDAIERMHGGNARRHFAFFNQATGCWLVFFFQYGGDSESFRKHAHALTRYKLTVEMRRHGFHYSVFGYAFRKSAIHTESTFDEILLSIEDASSYDSISESEYQDTLQFFGAHDEIKIREFPD